MHGGRFKLLKVGAANISGVLHLLPLHFQLFASQLHKAEPVARTRCVLT